MTVLQDYADFILEYAPYFYYTPDVGVDPVWGKGPAAAVKIFGVELAVLLDQLHHEKTN